MAAFDLVVRNGLLYDGTGGTPYEADVAVQNGRIAEIGKNIAPGREEIDAKGAILTPGFVDVHTHYDGQAIWSNRLEPSSNHGVTTAIIGNCGVGFAPCRPKDREMLVHMMEGVEDIPGAAMAEGLTWEWESFPEYLDALERRERDIDVAAYIPHSAIRVYVMGERGGSRELATPDDISRMQALVREGMNAGAVGFASSRQWVHRTSAGEFIPSYDVSVDELKALVEAMGDKGLFQIVLDVPHGDWEEEVRVLKRIISSSNCTSTFSFGPNGDGAVRALKMVKEANAAGSAIRPQVLPRATGIIVGHNLTANPFMDCPTYRALPENLSARVTELRKPEVRARILSEEPTGDVTPLQAMSNDFACMFELGDPPNYEPNPERSILARAKRRGVDPRELAYDLLLESDGHAMLYVPLGNYAGGTLDPLYSLLQEECVVIGLGDGGAHYGMICDASYPTFMLTHWVRDRCHGRLPLEEVVRSLSAKNAETVGFRDRGCLLPGLKADINIIDIDNLALLKPTVSYDLPAGGRRIRQEARGYVATIVNGVVIRRYDEATGALPGRLVRAYQAR